MAEYKMAELKMAAINQVESEWMTLMIELDWVRLLCKMAEFNMEEFKMVTIIKLIRWN